VAYYRPRTPTELAEQRVQLLADDRLWENILLLALADPGYIDPIETRASLQEAKLWWIGADCCELLAQAAPTMPPITLDPDLVPDVHGFAFLENPIVGRDAVHAIPISFDAIQWQPEFIRGLPGLAITMWAQRDDTKLPPSPLGRSDWPYGFDTDHQLPDTPARSMASIIEDRQLLAALWQLTSQTELVASTEERPYRAAAKRIARSGHEPQPVRLVYLNRRTGHRNSPVATPTREYTHRWIVRPHWRQQPYGPASSLRRAQYIDAHVKGPKDKPLRVRQTVKVWNKPPDKR
jgi:hypothetical protein